MQARLFCSFGLVFVAVACAGAATGESGDSCPDATKQNPEACPAELPRLGTSCFPRGTDCSYAGQGSTGPDGCTKAVKVTCLVEGPDSGQPDTRTPTWWSSN